LQLSSRRRRRYNDLSESIREHLDEKIENPMEDGISREAATHAASREFGNVAFFEERGREVWRWPIVENI
jgi:putative ABC transport system permease protein